MVKIGDLVSSIKYRRWSDGIAIKIKIKGGVIVQMSSIIWFSRILILINLLLIMKIIIYVIKNMIIEIIKIVWSWKKISCSIKGELLFWNISFIQDIISKKRLFFIFEF